MVMFGGVLAFAPPGAARPSLYFVNEIVEGSSKTEGERSFLVLDTKGNPHVSYSSHFGSALYEIIYARRSGGVWTMESADPTSYYVGLGASLALDVQEAPHLAYYDAFSYDLKYAWKSGGIWTREFVDSSASIVGGYASVALDAEANACIGYYDFTASDLKYARKAGGVWSIEVVDSLGDVGRWPSLALDAQGNPHIAYQELTVNLLRYASKSGGAWTIEAVAVVDEYPGTFTSLALDPQGNPHISFYDETPADLKYAWKSGGVWTVETADGSANDAGQYTSLALDAAGNPHVSYYDVTTQDLKHARKSAGTWSTEFVDASTNHAGEWSSLALDAQSNPHISYFDSTSGDLRYAHASVRLVEPTAAIWPVGSRQAVQWAGIGPVSIQISHDGGQSYATVLESIIENSVSIRVPHLPTRFGRIRIRRESPFSTSDSDSFFTIDAAIALVAFDAVAAPDGNGARLAWSTEPGLEADIRYRLEAAAWGDDQFAPLHSGLLERCEYFDERQIAAGRYRLLALNALGEEYLLGETTARGALRGDRVLGAHPNPARGGAIEVLFRVPYDFVAVALGIYDASGRHVKALASGTRSAGVGVARWDGRDDRGRAVAPGIYFVRFSSAPGLVATERIVVVR